MQCLASSYLISFGEGNGTVSHVCERPSQAREVYAALLRTLDEEIGLKKIPTVGEEFDYNLHNAIQQVPRAFTLAF